MGGDGGGVWWGWRGGGGQTTTEFLFSRAYFPLKPFAIIRCMLNSANLVKSSHSAEKLQAKLVVGKLNKQDKQQGVILKMCKYTYTEDETTAVQAPQFSYKGEGENP